MQPEGSLISTYAEMSMVKTYMRLSRTEEHQFKELITILKDFPIWTEFLSKVNGIGPAIAAVIISELVAPPLVKYGITKAGEAAGSLKPAPEA